MTRPVIGLSCNMVPASWGRWTSQPAVLVHAGYVQHLQRAGARVLLIPPDSGDVDVLDGLDGLVFAGGNDIDPKHYGATPHERADTPFELRDTSEFLLYRGARERDLPFLGICRGLQIMAIAEGGSLHQHVPDLPNTVAHFDPETVFAFHESTFTEGSGIARILETTAYRTNSAHHQVVDSPGSLSITGYCEDGTVEVVEDPTARFRIGVQWHPEMMEDTRIFDAFLSACRS